MEKDSFVEYTPIVSIKGTSFKAQLGQVNGVWHIRITRGPTVITVESLSGLDADEITNMIQKAITLPGFSGYYANITAANLLRAAQKGEVFTPPEPELDLPPDKPRTPEYRPTLLSQMGISKSEPPHSKRDQTDEDADEHSDDSSESSNDTDLSAEEGTSEEEGKRKNPSSVESSVNEFVTLLKTSGQPTATEPVEKDCEISFPLAFSLDVATGFLSKEFGVSSVDKFRRFLGEKISSIWEVIPNEELPVSIERLNEWMNKIGFNSSLEEGTSGKVVLKFATLEPKQKLSMDEDVSFLPQSGFSSTMCKTLMEKLALLSNLKVEFQEDEDGLKAIFSQRTENEEEVLHL